VVGAGTASITATQAETSNFFSGSTSVPFVVSQANPVITNFIIPPEIYGSSPFDIVDPTSSSNGGFSYTSSNLSVATIAGHTITVVGAGTASITATQAETSNFFSGSTSVPFVVSQSTVENPLLLDNSNAISYFLTSNASYASISSNVNIDYDLKSSTEKTIVTNNATVTIRRG
jgi:hypothetical protein